MFSFSNLLIPQIIIFLSTEEGIAEGCETSSTRSSGEAIKIYPSTFPSKLLEGKIWVFLPTTIFSMIFFNIDEALNWHGNRTQLWVHPSSVFYLLPCFCGEGIHVREPLVFVFGVWFLSVTPCDKIIVKRAPVPRICGLRDRKVFQNSLVTPCMG